jgi:pimeloyl-ACP methyl ester carboxylesterase
MIVAAALAVLVAGLPLAATAATYLAGRHRGETAVEPLGPAGLALAFAREWLAATALLAAWPFRLSAAAGAGARRGTAVLVPELRCSSAGFWYLRRQLARLGWDVVPGLERTRDTNTQRAIVELDARLAGLPADGDLVIVGHGIGGLLAHRYAMARPGLRIRHVVTLGTPHGGSRALPYRLLGAAFEMPAATAPVDVIAMCSDFDAWLQPIDDAYCAGAFNIALRGIGHCAMLLSSQVAALLEENLATPVRTRSAPE